MWPQGSVDGAACRLRHLIIGDFCPLPPPRELAKGLNKVVRVTELARFPAALAPAGGSSSDRSCRARSGRSGCSRRRGRSSRSSGEGSAPIRGVHLWACIHANGPYGARSGHKHRRARQAAWKRYWGHGRGESRAHGGQPGRGGRRGRCHQGAGAAALLRLALLPVPPHGLTAAVVAVQREGAGLVQRGHGVRRKARTQALQLRQ